LGSASASRWRAPAFLATHGWGLANLYFCLAPDAFGVFTAIDGRDTWNYQHYLADPSREAGQDDPAAALHRAMGEPFAFDLLGTPPLAPPPIRRP